jgi:hypothetical protein
MPRLLNLVKRKQFLVYWKSNYLKPSFNIRLADFQLWILMSESNLAIKLFKVKLLKMEERILSSMILISSSLIAILRLWEGVLK